MVQFYRGFRVKAITGFLGGIYLIIATAITYFKNVFLLKFDFSHLFSFSDLLNFTAI